MRQSGTDACSKAGNGRIEDLPKILAELKRERDQIERAIRSLERLALTRHKPATTTRVSS
jgi:hypothetical protein